ncbi:MATE family efflux transporter [Wohlfahrtiimonas chitiniclastica]|uniref:MATE family efflux transporter n=1 Tax=Wohlfahrtiimonas chitiniclastica TaxID=400946 RepID=UPI001BCF0143|nr:MATE family efflux transporter [Wohlfahrtiimonas chitiniclastica]MBS7815756.1 MATE family efflux transporter [Wohlfahrtiimonas chitiniclastica]MBS7823330.1 MATE family efflux transporter [Wohlfahrtiimonas chitiniclastica]MBS7831108.1 MATE family efflux transporter [Wohlfahrtiimonas chitiniclastica]MBS7833075.1 MATE family efflux transporter [Wohlfahrtiimonas chitiniclastica]
MALSERMLELRDAPIRKLLWKYALPAIIGSSVSALYNIITRYFIGNADYLNDDAMSAMGLALPIMTIIAAFGMLVGAGAGSRISIYLGNGDYEKAQRVVGTSLLLTLVITLTISFIFFFTLAPLVHFLGADEGSYQHTYDFLKYFLPGAIFSNLCFSFNNMMRASGYPKKAMYTMLLTLVLNGIFAPIFIYWLKWGMEGAAISIILSMFIGTLFVMQHFVNGHSVLQFKAKYIRFDAQITKAVLSIGLSPFLMNIVSSSIIFIIIQQVRVYGGSVAVGAYTIVNVLLMLVVLVLLGLTQGMQPIVGYSFGAKEIARLREALLQTIKIGVGIGIVAMVIGVFFPEWVIMPFNPSPALSDVAISAIRIVTMLFPLVGFQIVVTIFFQSIGKVKHSIFLSLSRQILFLIPGLFILPHYFGIAGVWYAIVVADLISTCTAALFLWIQIREFNRYLKGNA